MPFQKGHKFSPGGKKGNKGGPKTKEEKAEKLTFLQALERGREARAAALAAKYYQMAMEDAATMRHAVDRVMPPAKQEIGVSGTLIFKSNVPEGKP